MKIKEYDNWSVLKETHETPSGSYVVDYSYKDDDTPQAITYNPANGGTSTTYYYLTDGHGDIREITDKQGNTLVKYSYDAFGSPTMATIPPSLRGSEATEAISRQLIKTNPYTYSSYRYDFNTGMYYLRARYYDPVTGRFLSKDPILKESIKKEISDIAKANPLVKDIADELINDIKQNHPYAYAKNNPMNYVDPDGLWSYRFGLGFGSYAKIWSYLKHWVWHAGVYLYLTVGGAALLGIGKGASLIAKKVIAKLGGGWVAKKVGPKIASWLSKYIPKKTLDKYKRYPYKNIYSGTILNIKI